MTMGEEANRLGRARWHRSAHTCSARACFARSSQAHLVELLAVLVQHPRISGRWGSRASASGNDLETKSEGDVVQAHTSTRVHTSIPACLRACILRHTEAGTTRTRPRSSVNSWILRAVRRRNNPRRNDAGTLAFSRGDPRTGVVSKTH